jgi:lysyl-tRNA synthetase class 1
MDKLCAILRRQHIPMPAPEILQSRVAYAQYWLQHFSPAEIRLRLHKELPAQVAHLTPSQRQALGILGQRLRPEMDGDTIHAMVYALAEEVGLPAKALFEAIYIALLDQSRGPRVGWFLSSLEYDFVRTRLRDAAAMEG